MSGIRWMSARKFREGLKDGTITDPSEIGIHVGFNAETSVIRQAEDGEESRQMLFSISSAAVDRDTDTVSVDGWDLVNYRKNPVVLFGHNYWNNEAPVVGKSLSEFVADKRLKSLMEFTPQGLVPLADTLHGLYSNGFMHATSVGFIANEFAFVEDDEERPFGIDFSKQELLEYSLVPVPSNPDALSEARSKSIDTQPLYDWTEEILDEWKSHKSQSFWLPKTKLREIRAQADPKQGTTSFVPKGGDSMMRTPQEFIASLNANQASGFLDSLSACSAEANEQTGSFTVTSSIFPYYDPEVSGIVNFEITTTDGTVIDMESNDVENWIFGDADIRLLEEASKDATEPKTKDEHTLILCPLCGDQLEVRLADGDQERSIECEKCEGTIEVKLSDDGGIDIVSSKEAEGAEPGWLIQLRELGAPDFVIEAAVKAHERGDAATGDSKDTDSDVVVLSDGMVDLLEMLGVDIDAVLAKDTDANDDPDNISIDLESIEVVDEDGTRCGLRSFFEQLLPESIDEGVKAAVDNVLQT